MIPSNVNFFSICACLRNLILLEIVVLSFLSLYTCGEYRLTILYLWTNQFFKVASFLSNRLITHSSFLIRKSFLFSSYATSRGSCLMYIAYISKIYVFTVCRRSVVNVDIFIPSFVGTSPSVISVSISLFKSCCNTMMFIVIFGRPNSQSISKDPTLIVYLLWYSPL